MTKPLPPNTLAELLVPNARYGFFDSWPNHPFKGDADGFDLVNAWWLSEASFLAYDDAAFVSKTLETSGLKAAGYTSRFIEQGGTQCYVLSDGKVALVAFRGTQLDDFWPSLLDFVMDSKFFPAPDGAGGLVHEGFLACLELVWDDLRAELQKFRAAPEPPTLWLAGHSLGGAIATLAADRAQRELDYNVAGLYTFGCPRVGDTNFKARLATSGLGQRAYRVVNNSDLTATVPPDGFYHHVGRLKLIDGDGALHHLDDEPKLSLREVIPRKLRGLLSASPSAASALGKLKIPIPKFLADHAPVLYSTHLWNNFH